MKPGRPAKVERNADIARRHLAGETLAAIGDSMGISRERVRQIVRKEGVTLAQSYYAQCFLWKCEACGRTRMRKDTQAARARRFCGRECKWACREPARHRHPDGHWWVRDPRTGKRMRVERYLAQERIGRRLRRDEWVVLLDGNPDNLDPDNIAVMDPKAATRHSRDYERWRKNNAAATRAHYARCRQDRAA